MQLRLKTVNQVRVFALAITLLAAVLSVLIKLILEPPEIFYPSLPTGIIIPMMITPPIAYFIGIKMLEVHQLTVLLEHAVNHDNLTGTCSRANFFQLVAGLPEDEPLVVVVADIDHFKLVNDRYGHQVGDRALKQFSASLVRNCREDDIVARFGGEEFVILLRETVPENGLVTAERLRKRVRRRPMKVGNHEIGLTASFGVAEVMRPSEMDVALHRADLAAYRAKREGRDRACIFDPRLDVELPPAAAE